MWFSNNWHDYECLDCSDGERLERWGKYILIRPDPQVIWQDVRRHPMWKKADAVYSRSAKGGGGWSDNRLPESWEVGYGALTFRVKPMGFKHTGLFPEQASNWDWFAGLIRERKKNGESPRVLNLFAYTGGATAAALEAGASVCHVDASKGMIAFARDNMQLSGLSEKPVRYIVDDCMKFVAREMRRGSAYDGIIMDPPSYGRGPGGEVWKLEDNIAQLISATAGLLSDKPLFFLINSYTTGLSANTVRYLAELYVAEKHGGSVEAQELALPVTQTGGFLPCGSSARWTPDK